MCFWSVGGVLGDCDQVGNGNEFYLTSLRSTDNLIVGGNAFEFLQKCETVLYLDMQCEFWLADGLKDGTALIELEKSTGAL